MVALSALGSGLALSKATVHCELADTKGYLNLLDCHLVISQSSASYHTSSERGEAGLSADPKIFNVLEQIYVLKHILELCRPHASDLNILGCHTATS